MRHVAQYGEDDKTCEEAGQTIDTARQYGVPVNTTSILISDEETADPSKM